MLQLSNTGKLFWSIYLGMIYTWMKRFHTFFEFKRYGELQETKNISYVILFLKKGGKNFHDTWCFKTGLPDFQKLVLTMLRNFEPRPPPIWQYRDYINFGKRDFEMLLASNTVQIFT